MKPRRLPLDRPWLAVPLVVAVMIAVAFLVVNFKVVTMKAGLICGTTSVVERNVIPIQLHAVLHYATTRDIPQQSTAEIRVSFDVLFSLYPCNFLVFGLGHDSLMWASFNPNGFTMFLEEDPNWIKTVLTKAPNIRVYPVGYKTHLYDAKNLLAHYKAEPNCLPPKLHLQGNTKCRLVLSDLPNEVYDKEWDVIMIDGPKGYLPDLPGRMAAIYTVAVMARMRTRPGVTHVILHDVNRKVERVYAQRFLCRKYLVKAVGRLWHFVIPPASKDQNLTPDTFFC
ncbi:probable methyltransferase At1g27930 [Chenopodium quinoa]|uniref:probable methyltransferase At1g27930 n=1 Tax=Chenopodium quinoa TaxID=63459 RepID=UPI000B77A723|nr:probable methyltransferase At1g27930 [Chenopodium quinoa]